MHRLLLVAALLTAAGLAAAAGHSHDAESDRIAYWQFHHEGDTQLETGTWEDWVTIDGVSFATNHRREDGRTRVWTKDITRIDSPPAARLETP